MAAARAGDRAALGALLEAHYARIYALCRRMTGGDADALDATQDAMVAAVRSVHRFDGRSAFGTWLYRVAVNACLDELRRRRRRPLAPPGHEDRAGTADPEATAIAAVDVDAALTALAPEFRAAVVLRDLCELTYDEIAEVLAVPPGTVRSRIARGRAALADALGDGDATGSGNPDRAPGVQRIVPDPS